MPTPPDDPQSPPGFIPFDKPRRIFAEGEEPDLDPYAPRVKKPAELITSEPVPPPQLGPEPPPIGRPVTRNEATIRAPSKDELSAIGFTPSVSLTTGETLPKYDEEALVELREAKGRRIAQQVRDQPLVPPKGHPMGDEYVPFQPTVDWAAEDPWSLLTPAAPIHLGAALGKQIAESFQGNMRDAGIYEKARLGGFSSLDEDDLEWAEKNWTPQKLQMLHATTTPQGEDLTEDALSELIAEHQRKDFPWSYNPETRSVETLTEEEQEERKEQAGVADLSDEEIANILGIDFFEARSAERQREAVVEQKITQRKLEQEKTQNVRNWEAVRDSIEMDLSIPARDTKVRDFVDKKGQLDFWALENAIVPKIANAALVEEFGEGAGMLSPGTPPEAKRIAWNNAKKEWFKDKSLLLTAGKGGVPFFDVDPTRTTDKMIEILKDLEGYSDLKAGDAPMIGALAREMGAEAISLHKLIDPFLSPSLGLVGGSQTLVKAVRYSPATLPLLSATTPSYTLSVSPTHKEFAARTTLDSLNSWFPTTWIAAAEKTHAEITRHKVGSSEYATEFFETLTGEKIAQYSGSGTLGEVAAAYGGGEDQAGLGLMKLLHSDPFRTEGLITPSPESIEHGWKSVLGAYNMGADFMERWVGATGDETNTRLMIQNLRQGNMLFMAHAEAANDLADAMGFSDDTRGLLLSTAILSGLTAEFAPGTGADPLTAFLGLGGAGIKTIMGAERRMASTAKKLRKIRLSKMSYEKKLIAIEGLDPATAAWVKAQHKQTVGYHAQAASYISKTERSLEASLQRAEDIARTAGYEASPFILPGSKYLDEGYAEQDIERRIHKATKEPSEISIRAGIAPKKDFKSTYGELDDVIEALKAEGQAFPRGFQQWKPAAQEAYIRRLAKHDLSESVRAQAQIEIQADIAQVGERIGRTTVAGDVYRVDGQPYIRYGTSAEEAVWIPVREADIPKARELTVTEDLTTRTPLRPIEWKSQLLDEWSNRPRGAMETPWGKVALERQNLQAAIRAAETEASLLRANKKPTPEDTAQLGKLQDDLAVFRPKLKELTKEEVALRKTFPDYEVPSPRIDTTSGVPQELNDIVGDPALWRSHREMVGGVALSVRKPVLPPRVSQQAKILEAEADALKIEFENAQVRLHAAEKELEAFMGGEGQVHTQVVVTRKQLVNAVKREERLGRRLAAAHKKFKPELVKAAKLKKKVDDAEAAVIRAESVWTARPTTPNRAKVRTAEGRVATAEKTLTKQAQKMFPLEAEIKELQSAIFKNGAAQRALEIFLIGPTTPGRWLKRTNKWEGSKPGTLEYLTETDVTELGRYRMNLEAVVRGKKWKAKWIEKKYLATTKNAKKEARSHIEDVKQLVRNALSRNEKQAGLLELDNTLTRMADEIDGGLRALKDVPNAEGAFNRGLEKSHIEFQTGGGRIINPKLFVSEMVEAFNPATLKGAAEFGGQPPMVLSKILDASRDSNTLGLTLQESMQLQQVLPYLTRAYKKTHLDQRGMAVVEALRLAKGDPDLALHSFRGLIEANAMSFLRDVFDPIRREIGEVSSLVSQVVKGAGHLTDHVRDEIYMIGRAVEAEAKRRRWDKLPKIERDAARADYHQKLLYAWLEGTEGVRVYKTRATYFNTGETSVWEQALHQIKNDPRTLGTDRLLQRAKYEQKILKERVKKGDLPKDTEIPSAKELMENRWGASIHTIPTHGDGQVLRAMARAFLPDGAWEGLTASKQAALYTFALEEIHRTKNVSSFFKAMLEFTASKKIDLERYTNETKALQVFAYALAHGAIQHRTNKLFQRAVGGSISSRQASDIYHLMDNSAEQIQDMDGMLDALNRIGTPFTARRVKPSHELPERELRLMASGVDDGGNTYFMPQAIVETIDANMPKIIKDVTERFVSARGSAAILKTGADFQALSLWKTSVVTGVLIPRPTYWWNNFIGDLSQVWLNQGFHQAAKLNTNLLHTVSLNVLETMAPQAVRKRFARIQQHHIDKYGAERAQGSIWNALFNPVANKIWRGETGVLRTKGAKEYSYRELRHYMENEGILDTMVHAELLDSYHRVTPDRWKGVPILGSIGKGVEAQRYNISSFATFVQQRQRGNLFMELVRQGKTPREAGRLVRESLYDWKHALAKREIQTIGKVSPFYRFWKLGFNQVASSILEPAIHPSKAMIQSLTGRSGLSRIRQQWATTQAWPQFWDPDGYTRYQDSAEKYDALAKYKRPSWSRLRAVNFIEKNDADRMAHLQTVRGKAMDWSMGVMPPATALDLTELIGSLSMGMLYWGLDAEVVPNPWEGKLPGDWEENLFKPALDLLFPHIGDPLNQYLLSQGADTGAFELGQDVRISPGTAFIIDKLGIGHTRGRVAGAAVGAALGFKKSRGGAISTTLSMATGAAIGAATLGLPLEGKVDKHPDYQFPRTDVATASYMRLIPFVGTELPALLDAAWFKNTKMQKAWREDQSGFSDYVKGMGSFLSTFSGLAKRHEFSDEDTVKYRRLDIDKQRRDYEKAMGVQDLDPKTTYKGKTVEELFPGDE